MASIEAAHTSGHEHVITAPHADSAILGCDTVINLTAAIDTDPGTGIGVRAQVFDSRQAGGRSIQSIDPPSAHRTIPNDDVNMTVNQNTTERPAHAQHSEAAQVESYAVGIDPNPALTHDIVRYAI